MAFPLALHMLKATNFVLGGCLDILIIFQTNSSILTALLLVKAARGKGCPILHVLLWSAKMKAKVELSRQKHHLVFPPPQFEPIWLGNMPRFLGQGFN